MELSGTWRAHVADDELRRHFADDAFDDSTWPVVAVPGHWRSHPALADSDGPVLYRTTIAIDPPAEGTRSWLVFDGIFTQGDVWLDGIYIGDTEGYTVLHRFEITDAIAGTERRDHVLAVEVTCPPVGDATAKRVLTGAFQDGDHVEPRWNPGGIWRPVRIEQTGALAVRYARLRCLDADEDRATLGLRIVVDTHASGTATFVTRVTGPLGERSESVVVEHELQQPIAVGENRVTWTVPVPEPSLWWPHALGAPSRYAVEVAVLLDDGTVSDTRRWVTGLRTVELRGWTWYVNGERLFVKGASLSPTRPDLAAASVAEITRDLELARDAGLDLVRLHTHVSRPELYEAADELGLLVWQDLPLHRKYARSVKAQAVRQTRETIDLLAHHPSVALWCAHNEPYLVDEKQPPAAAEHGSGRRPVPRLLRQQIPSWNRAVLDRAVKRELETSDGTRPVLAHSGVLPHLPQLDGTDSHLWFGWYGGRAADIELLAARVPREVRFVSEFGAQALPDDATFCDPDAWPDLDWARLARDHGMQVSVFERVTPHAASATFRDWQVATQLHQAQVVDRTIRSLRRLKYRPTGGFALYRLVDVRPDSVGFGVLDHERRPKAAWHALVEACRPAIVTADPLPERLLPGDRLRLDVHVVNDLRVELDEVTVVAHVCWTGGEYRTAWLGAVEADACVRVGTLDLEVPDAPGPFDLTLTMQAGEHVSTAIDRGVVGPLAVHTRGQSR